MSDKSAIEWTNATWNCVTGCTKVSPGCAFCYIDRSPPFRIAGRKFVNGATGVRLHPERLEQPLRWKRPRYIFVNSLSDVFHEEIPDAYITQMFDVMGKADQHIFQVLTKRPTAALAFLRRYYGDSDPHPNVWMGVTIENARHNYRADVLRQMPAALRFISAEPLLGSLFHPPTGFNFPSVKMYDGPPWCAICKREKKDHAWASRHNHTFTPVPDAYAYYLTCADCGGRIDPRSAIDLCPRCASDVYDLGPLNLDEIDWVIAGGESGGRHVRPMHPKWARELRDACQDSGVAYFFKQWGSYGPVLGKGALVDYDRDVWAGEFGGKVKLDSGESQPANAAVMRYVAVGGKPAGKLLDGREWCEMPGGKSSVAA
jgi:protein gp37